MEQYHLRVALGTRLWNAYFRREKQRLLMSQLQHSQVVTLAAVAPSAPQTASLPILSKIQAIRYGNTDWIAHNISPLTLKSSDQYPRRANLLLATIDFRYVFGGYLAMFNLALRLHRAGYKTRIILVEKTDFDPEAWRDQIQRYPGLESLFDDVEVIYRYDRSIPVEINPGDAFVATSCWTAHIANHALKQLNRDNFTFLVQDYEPVFVPMNSVHALFSEAYTFPQYNLFSTGLLRDYFRLNRIGIYADSAAYGDERSTSFENAIYKATVDSAALHRERKRLLFYARPEPHAARNMFELGMLSLIEAVKSGEFDVSNWSFHGIGSIDMNVRLELAPDVELQLVPRSSPQEYVEMLPTFDVGLSLMLTPHPSLVPLEMASAGMWTVTNSYANKTRDKLEAITSNLIVAEPTISGIKAGLLQAIAAVDDIDSRVRGSDVHWATDWNTAFNNQVIDKLRTFLD